ncbi:hypothetical protein [Fontivita pretiosa]|uniref:hypothetical protein n=1 Tax=Fontivita pretiosa TaxID=2989684 RepID=UPI003D16CEDD
MRFVGSGNFLGIAIGERSMTCAEVCVRRRAGQERAAVRRAATFTLGPERSMDKPESLGEALAGFLRANGFGASRAVVGVPARWLVAVEKEVPPAEREQLHAILRLQAERLAIAESTDTVFDYVDAPRQPDKPGRVLLVAMLRKQLERIEQVMEAAGLRLIAVTPTALALATMSRPEHSSQPFRAAPLLLLGGHGAELVLHNAQGQPRALRHVALAVANGHESPAVATLGAELRRTVLMAGAMPAATSNGQGQGAGVNQIVLWDGLGLSGTQIAELSDRSGFKIQPADRLPAVEADATADGAYAPAVALALCGMKRTLPLDFAHSRLAPRPTRRFGRRGTWAAAIGVVAVLTIGLLYQDLRQQRAELEALQSRLSELAPDIKLAENLLDRINYGRGYFETRPPVLECLREITQMFRDDEPIWATSFTIRENRRGQLSGKAADSRTPAALADRMRRNPNFNDVKVMDVSETGSGDSRGGRAREWAFSISFTYTAVE